jgi:glycerol-3-phosphate dehydrogenase (NAD(P)+)
MSSAGGMSERPAAIRQAVTLEGAAAIEVIGGALPKLTGRGIIEPEEFPLMRHLHSVVGLDKPLDMPWHTFFGGEPEYKRGKG